MTTTITKSTKLFPAELTKDVFNKVKGHSALAKLSGSDPIPFVGTTTMTFSMDGEMGIVGEGEAKNDAGDAGFKPVTVSPLKITYSHRITDEFMNMTAEQQMPYMNAYIEGFKKKVSRALDIMAMHGYNPKTKTESEKIGTNCLDKLEGVTEVQYNAAENAPDDIIDDAVLKVQDNDMEISGIAMSPSYGAALGKMKTGNKTAAYPEFRFAGNPGNFCGLKADVNNTVSFNSPTNKIVGYIGDFANAFKWGFAKDIAMKVIEYGDPDGVGTDLQNVGQICLRCEAYIGWGFLESKAFARIKDATV